MDINGKTVIYGLIGNPVSHSISPKIHNYLFREYKQNGAYVCFNIEENNLRYIKNSINTLNIKGINVTIPYKVQVINYLDGLDEKSRLIGSVNTIKRDNDSLIGFNTDGIGFVKSIEDKGYCIRDKSIMILGAGGSARSISVELASKGIKSLTIRNRSTKNAKEICEVVSNEYKVECDYSTEEVTNEDLRFIDILINTTPVGMCSDDCPIDMDISFMNKEMIVCDIIYAPRETQLIKLAKKNSLNVVYGIDMLVNQALESFRIWTDIEVDEIHREKIKELLEKGD